MAVRTQNMVKRQCPQCKGTNIAKVEYGTPAPGCWEELQRKVDSGKLVLGGCIVPPFPGKYACTDCHLEWDKKDGEIRVAPTGVPLDMLDMPESGNGRSAKGDPD